MTDLTNQNQNKHLKSLINSMDSISVLVIGDIMLDRFVYGGVERISPESPVPVLSVEREDKMLGGAGNVLSNLAGLCVGARIFGVIGDDAEGQEIVGAVKDLGFEPDDLVTDAARPSIVKTRYLAGHQQLLRTDYENKSLVDNKICDQIVSGAEAAMKEVQVVVISDYGKGLLSADVLKRVIDAAKTRNLPVIVDPKGLDFSIYAGADVVTPNKKELSEATGGMPIDTDKEAEAAAQKIIRECRINAVIATRSKDGMSVVKKDDEPLHLQVSKNIEVFDVSGAGDSVIATIAATLAVGGDLNDAGVLANIAGGRVVMKVGTAPIRRDELLEDLADVSASSDRRDAAYGSWQEAAEQVKRWRAQGLTVGFTNGCFDIVHQGHVTYLNETKNHCDRLVLGLNSDASVRILKGDDRPVHDEIGRSLVMGGLKAVDMVVLFGAEEPGDDNTAIDLLKTLKPDVYFKGGDYKVEEIPEAPSVQAYGGQVKVLSNVEGHSTTNSIKKMRGAA